jgi:hypothetical protein
MKGTITDRFEMKGRTALEYGAEGVVVIFRHDPHASPPAQGDAVLLVRPDGWLYAGKAEDVRFEPSAAASGLFLRGLTKEDVPLGAEVRWGQEIAPLRGAVASIAG